MAWHFCRIDPKLTIERLAAVRSRHPGPEIGRPYAGKMVRLRIVARNERTPRLRSHRAFGLPDHGELAVGPDFTYHYRLVQVMIGIQLLFETAGGVEFLAVRRLNHFVDVRGACFFDGLLPDVHSDGGGFLRIAGHPLVTAWQVVLLHVSKPRLLESVVNRILERHEIIPCGQIP